MKTCTRTLRFTLLGFVTLALHTIDLQAQVTIGLGSAPAKAGLLQLKEQEPDADNVTCKTGGFILPRVALVNLKTLEPFVNPTETGYDSEKSKNIGLLVYNMTKTSPFVPGLYLWDGDKWAVLRTLSDSIPTRDNPGSVPVEPNAPSSMTDPAALKLSNSFIVGYNKTIDIPVIKAYAVWNQLLNLNEVGLQGTVSVELLWEDKKDLIKEVTLASGDKGTASMLRVTTNSNNLQGNAVVAVRINNVIRWSWHIWVTNYDPDVLAGEKVYNNTIFMDRNLGAINTTPGNIGSLGLLYQWGRKDPFPGSSAVDDNLEIALYTLSGGNVAIGKSKVNNSLNMPTSIINPYTFYYSTDGNQDWYSNSGTTNNYLWNDTDNTKGTYDPCPKGWRVPRSGSGSNSPWNGLGGGGPAFDKGKGEEWTVAGYYPAAGYRDPATGNLTMVGLEGYNWSATAFYSTVYRLFFKSYYIQVDATDNRAKGSSIRCIKE